MSTLTELRHRRGQLAAERGARAARHGNEAPSLTARVKELDDQIEAVDAEIARIVDRSTRTSRPAESGGGALLRLLTRG